MSGNSLSKLFTLTISMWHVQVAQCTWIERKIAATLFGEPPSATVQDALQNFLKVQNENL